jgi:hypothetical protein
VTSKTAVPICGDPRDDLARDAADTPLDCSGAAVRC